MLKDLSNQTSKTKKQKSLPSILQILIFIGIALLVLFAITAYQATRYRDQVTSLIPEQFYPVALSEMTVFTADKLPPRLQWREDIVSSGDVLGTIFARNGITSMSVLESVVSAVAPQLNLKKLQPGEQFAFGFNADGQLRRVTYTVPKKMPIIIVRDEEDKFVQLVQNKDERKELSFVHGIVKTSFWQAAKSAGLSDKQVLDLANLFAWDIDFALDIRKGDHFELLFEETYLDGLNSGGGEIVVARFTNMGKTSTSILNANGSYYDEQARDMRKTFLRAPLDFRRVSSDFNPTRRHPVTGRVTRHNGTDYAAAVGTPIWAAGDGIVLTSAYTSVNGNYIVVKHNDKYTTKYLHLSKRIAKAGEKVKQGETIGLLGGTGRVTGPHLHYEFLVNGVHHNPRTIELPLSNSLNGAQKEAFLAHAKTMIQRLERFDSFYKRTKKK